MLSCMLALPQTIKELFLFNPSSFVLPLSKRERKDTKFSIRKTFYRKKISTAFFRELPTSLKAGRKDMLFLFIFPRKK